MFSSGCEVGRIGNFCLDKDSGQKCLWYWQQGTPERVKLITPQILQFLCNFILCETLSSVRIVAILLGLLWSDFLFDNTKEFCRFLCVFLKKHWTKLFAMRFIWFPGMDVCFVLHTTTVPEYFKALKVDLGHGKPCKQIWSHRKFFFLSWQENIWKYLEPDESVQRCKRVFYQLPVLTTGYLTELPVPKPRQTETTRPLFTQFQGMSQKAGMTFQISLQHTLF